MSERRYSDEEVAAIFERATSETERATLPSGGESHGMTLAALQDIGKEVGISPESIAIAARSLDQTGRPVARTFIGLPIGVGRTVELDRPITDQDWERLVGDLRETFEAKGVVRYDGPFRQWTNGNLQALVEPTPTGHRVRLQTYKADSRAFMGLGLALTGMSAATAIALAMSGSLGQPGVGTGIGFLAIMGLSLFGIGAGRLPGWARRRKEQIEQVLARLATRREPG